MVTMNKIFYFIAATIRIIGPYLSRFSNVIKTLVYYMTARTQGGITARFWIAVVMSVCALLIDVFYLHVELELLPSQVPLTFDIYGDIAEWGDKSVLRGYTEARVSFFMILAFTGWVICKVKGGTLMAQRIRLFVVDVANLVITTGVAMAAVYIEIAKGNSNQKLAEEWEYAVMCFWLLTLVLEFILDKKHVKEADVAGHH